MSRGILMKNEISLKDLPLHSNVFLHKIHSDRKAFKEYEFFLEVRTEHSKKSFWKTYKDLGEIFRGFPLDGIGSFRYYVSTGALHITETIPIKTEKDYKRRKTKNPLTKELLLVLSEKYPEFLI